MQHILPFHHFLLQYNFFRSFNFQRMHRFFLLLFTLQTLLFVIFTLAFLFFWNMSFTIHVCAFKKLFFCLLSDKSVIVDIAVDTQIWHCLCLLSLSFFLVRFVRKLINIHYVFVYIDACTVQWLLFPLILTSPRYQLAVKLMSKCLKFRKMQTTISKWKQRQQFLFSQVFTFLSLKNSEIFRRTNSP